MTGDGRLQVLMITQGMWNVKLAKGIRGDQRGEAECRGNSGMAHLPKLSHWLWSDVKSVKIGVTEP